MADPTFPKSVIPVSRTKSRHSAIVVIVREDEDDPRDGEIAQVFPAEKHGGNWWIKCGNRRPGSPDKVEGWCSHLGNDARKMFKTYIVKDVHYRIFYDEELAGRGKVNFLWRIFARDDAERTRILDDVTDNGIQEDDSITIAEVRLRKVR